MPKTQLTSRVLAFNDRGRELLKEMQDSAQLPVIIKLGRNVLEKYGEKVEQQLSVDIAATNLLTLCKRTTNHNTTTIILSLRSIFKNNKATKQKAFRLSGRLTFFQKLILRLLPLPSPEVPYHAEGVKT